MRIITENHHDYYDSVLGLGQDPNLVWIRHPEVVKYTLTSDLPSWLGYGKKPPTADIYPFPNICISDVSRPKTDDLNMKQFVVGFCGKVYPLLTVGIGWESERAYCYTLAEVDQFVETHFKERRVEAYKSDIPGDRWHRPHGDYWVHRYRQVMLKKFFDEYEERKSAFDELFKAKRCPVFVGEYRYWNDADITYHANNLKELGFVRIFDPFTAYQEIAMYFGNMAVPPKEPPAIDDKTMAEAKGFNRFSFRKDPTKKKS